MATTITMPQLGETVTEGTVAQWLKSVGDAVDKYEAFVEVSTDKVNADVPSPVTGTIRELLVKEGETVATGTPIAVIEEVGAASASSASPAPAASAPAAAPAAPPAATERPQSGASSNGSPSPVAADGAEAEGALRGASPAVRRLAREHHIDIRALKGSGTNGRVTAGDVLAAASTGAPAGSTPAHRTRRTRCGADVDLRATDSRHDDHAHASEAHHRRAHGREPSHGAACVVDGGDRRHRRLEMARSREGSLRTRDGLQTYAAPILHSRGRRIAAAFPLMNARFVPADGSNQANIYVNGDVNVGVAIGLPTNLVVPVIKNADKLSIKGLAVAAGELIEKARKGKLGVDDLAGGTFTVNNNGANGSWASAPIINGGQAGIVTMETVVKKLAVRDDDSIAIRSMMNSCLSLDHRVVDGYVASGFLADLKRRLERMGPQGEL